MNKYILSMLLALSSSQLLPITKQQDNFLKRQYKSIKSDLELIKKCYGTTSPACTDNERMEARKAMLRVGGKIGAVIGTIFAISGIGTWWYLRFGRFKDNGNGGEPLLPKIEGQQLENLKTSLKDVTGVTIQDIKFGESTDKLDVIVGSAEDVNKFMFQEYDVVVPEALFKAYPSLKGILRVITIKNPMLQQPQVSYPIVSFIK